VLETKAKIDLERHHRSTADDYPNVDDSPAGVYPPFIIWHYQFTIACNTKTDLKTIINTIRVTASGTRMWIVFSSVSCYQGKKLESVIS
jgi:hypothetical protein